MPYNPNDPNFQTGKSRILSFNNFQSNVGREKEDLEKAKRPYIDNDETTHQIPTNRKFKFNRVTNKMDDISKDEVEDKLDYIEDMGVINPKHKYKFDNRQQQISEEK